MIPILSRAQSLDLDKITIELGFHSEKDLMDNAGKSIAQFIMENIEDPFNHKFVIISGPGNNGGDGIICHYYLTYYGAHSELLLLNESQKESWIFNEYSIDTDSIQMYVDTYYFSPLSWYIDSIFGIGLQRELKGEYKEAIRQISDLPNIISIDIPSGIYSDTGMAAAAYVDAGLTLTMGYAKWGHYFNAGLDSTGELIVLDIGLKGLEENEKCIQLVELEDVQAISPMHSENTQKYNHGKIVSVAGSSGFTGACILAAKAALKVGTGIIKALVPESLGHIYEIALIEVITVGIPDQSSGTFTIDNVDQILDKISWGDTVLFGPGLKVSASDTEWMIEVLKNISKPLILDASGFQPLIAKTLKIDDLPQETILTPHHSEFSQIFDIDVQDVINDPIGVVQNIIPVMNGRVLILKGGTNIIVTSKGNILLMNHGRSALATAGTGDVLSGILASVTAQGLNMDEAAIYSTYLHAECSHQYSQRIGKNGLIASDLIKMLPFAQEIINDVP